MNNWKKTIPVRALATKYILPAGKDTYSPLPNIRPGPNNRLAGDKGSKLISDQDLFTDHLGLFPKF